MANGGFKNSSIKSQYKYVYPRTLKHKTIFVAQINRLDGWSKIFETEKEAAKAVDLKLIEKGFEPVNILKPLK